MAFKKKLTLLYAYYLECFALGLSLSIFFHALWRVSIFLDTLGTFVGAIKLQELEVSY